MPRLAPRILARLPVRGIGIQSPILDWRIPLGNIKQITWERGKQTTATPSSHISMTLLSPSRDYGAAIFQYGHQVPHVLFTLTDVSQNVRSWCSPNIRRPQKKEPGSARLRPNHVC